MNGPQIYLTIPIFGGIPITETIVNMWILMAVILLLCLWLAHGLKDRPETRKQTVVELLISMLYRLVRDTMGERNLKYAPYIGTLFTISAFGSLSSLLGMRPITADLSTVLAWALVTFVIVQVVSVKTIGVKRYGKSFLEPIPILLPLNLISTVANPISMAFRHFGNIASGLVISSLLYSALAALSSLVLSIIPNAFLRSIPIFQLGLPAFLSIYFDLFTSFLQAFIFCMLTMVFIAGANEE